MSLMPLMFFQGIEGYVGRSNPLVVLSRFFKLSPMAISNMHVASSKTMPEEEQRKSSVECTSFVRSSSLSIADRISSRMSNAILLFSEDKDSIF